MRWKDIEKDYMHERFVDRGRWIEQARRECVDRERWEALQPSPSPQRMFLERTRRQRL